MSYRDQLEDFPMVIRRLRRRAGHTQLSSAAKAIRKVTGHALSRSTLSKWEHGHLVPSVKALLIFLQGLGYDLRSLADELDLVAEGVSQSRPKAAPRKRRKPRPELPVEQPSVEDAEDLLRQLDEVDKIAARPRRSKASNA